MSMVSFLRWSMVDILATGFEVQVKLGANFELAKTIYATADSDYLTAVTLPDGTVDPVFKVVPFIQEGETRTYATGNLEVHAEAFGFTNTPASLVAGVESRLPFKLTSPYTAITAHVVGDGRDFTITLDEDGKAVVITPAETQTTGEVTVTLFLDGVIPAHVTIPLSAPVVPDEDDTPGAWLLNDSLEAPTQLNAVVNGLDVEYTWVNHAKDATSLQVIIANADRTTVYESVELPADTSSYAYTFPSDISEGDYSITVFPLLELDGDQDPLDGAETITIYNIFEGMGGLVE